MSTEEVRMARPHLDASGRWCMTLDHQPSDDWLFEWEQSSPTMLQLPAHLRVDRNFRVVSGVWFDAAASADADLIADALIARAIEANTQLAISAEHKDARAR